MAEPLDVIAERLAEIALREAPNVGRLGPGPVLTVVREPGGKIYIGLNTGIPQRLSDVMYKAILAQKARIWQGEVIVVRTDPQAFGGHAEVAALSPAIRDRERMLGRKHASMKTILRTCGGRFRLNRPTPASPLPTQRMT